MSFVNRDRGFRDASGGQIVYNETKPQPRIWQSATRASDHLIGTSERG